MNNNHAPKTGKTTVEYDSRPWYQRWLDQAKADALTGLMFFALGLVIFSVGSGFGSYMFPREVIVLTPSKTQQTKNVDSPPALLPQRNIDEEVVRLTERRIVEILEGCAGVLEIKDGEAQTVRYKKAAIGKKGGFTDIKKGVPYTIHSYFLHNKTGRGLVSDNENNLFFLDLQTGATNPPSLNPGTLTVISGKRVEFGKAK